MKKINLFWSLLTFVMAVTVSMGFTSCSEDDGDSVSVSNATITFKAEGASESVNVNSSTTWFASADSTWCTITPESGAGNGTIKISLKPNDSDQKRQCTITVCAGDANSTITITQEKGELTVTPTDVSLLKSANSTATITIKATGEWTATCTEEWLNLSSQSGTGNTNLTLTSLSDNNSAEARQAVVTVKSGGLSKEIVVKQHPKYIKAFVNIDINNAVVLTKSFAAKQTYDGAVSYYYAAYLSKSASAGWTDEKVVSTITSQFEAEKPNESGEDIFGLSGLSPNTSYILFTVAFNEKGEQGPLQRYEVTTPRALNNRPRVTFSNLSYSSSQWKWTTAIGPYAKRYYMIADEDIYAFIYSLYPPAMIAFEMQEKINNGDLSPMVNGGSWTMTRSSGSEDFYAAAWAQGDDGKFAGELDYVYADLSASSRVAQPSKDQKNSNVKIVSTKKLREDFSHAKVFEK